MAYNQKYYINYTIDDNGQVGVYSIEDYSMPYLGWYDYFASMCVV